MTYQKVEFRRKLRLGSGRLYHFTSVERCYADDVSGEDALKLAGNPDAIKDITDRAVSLLAANQPKSEDVLYIIEEVEPSGVCKIGRSYRPRDRLEQLQCSTWRELKIAAVFCPVKAKIDILEAAIHARARDIGAAVRGEWVSLDTKAATQLILEVARDKGYRLCGCDVYFDNMAARVTGLREAQLAERARWQAA